jgi:hypothetical protein
MTRRASPPPSARQAEFLRFCSRALGTNRKHPLQARGSDGTKDVPGATISALVEAFKEIEPRAPEVPKSLTPETFEGPQWREPWTVYAIRNTITGGVYVGRAGAGFLKRYPGGRWWEETHNARLRRDAEMYGVLSFRVSLWIEPDEPSMIRREAELQRAMRLHTYNEREDPDA